jgi:hypothetical protein
MTERTQSVSLPASRYYRPIHDWSFLITMLTTIARAGKSVRPSIEAADRAELQ